MQRIANYIVNLSPKETALYLVLWPALWLLAYIVCIGAVKMLDNAIPSDLIMGLVFISLAPTIIVLVSWFISSVHSVQRSDLGLPLKWFYCALVVLLIYLIYNLYHPFVENVNERFRSIFYAFSEMIAFVGVVIAYPVLCHYSARAILVKKTNKPATLSRALPFTFLVVFGLLISIPFLHRYLTNESSTHTEIFRIYGIAAFVLFATFIVGFLAAITGLI